jgi:excisionase family DNA binding protein
MIINGTKYLTIQQTADLVGKSHITIRKWIKDGMLQTTRFSERKIFIKEEDAINLTK